MGLIENCNRVKQNVENIYTVLEENGIVIPEGTTSDNLSGLISTNTVNLDDELAEQDSLLAELQSSLEGKAAGEGEEVILQSKTVTPSTNQQTVTADEGYTALESVTVNAMNVATQATPSITVSSGGLITASATQSDGYVIGGIKSATKQLTTQAAKTITPSTSSQTAVASGRYTTGNITVAAIPSNYEDVGTETNAYTTKLASLETAITSLETELAGKASGSSGGGAEIETCTVTLIQNNSATYVSYVGYVGLSADNKIEFRTWSGGYADGTQTFTVVKNTLLCTNNSYGLPSEGLSILDVVRTYPIYLVSGNGSLIVSGPCYLKNTPITLANRTTKLVQDITYEDDLLVWDFDNGCYASAKPLWIKKVQTASYYYKCSFENGLVLNLVGSNGNCHRVFSLDDNRFEYANNCIGKQVMTELGITTLLSCERVEEEVEFYNIITDYHMNLFANHVLTSCRLNNLYEIKDMKFVKEDRPHIVWDAYDTNKVSIDFYKGLRLSEQKDEDISMINDYVNNLNCLQKEV